ncbi:MAG: acyl-CoA dehydrogenase family protein [Actinomycetota bacterium]|nr:acyl-CoA dehydrogenase family protein [Actinomycetota bacterium]
MDFDAPPEDDAYRMQVRVWIEENPNPNYKQLVDAGYVVPHWPKPYGLEAGPLEQLIIAEEMNRAGIKRPQNPIGIGWAGPTILEAGTEEQKDKYLPGLLEGKDFWCQLFSEPDSGSDLANLSTRAERDGDEYVINGSKIWSSGAHVSKYGILIARTNPDAPKHKGISYFICPMDTPGISMSPIIDMTTAHSFNQVFFDDVRLTSDHLVGEEGDGWRLAKVTLANERVQLSSAGSLWGAGPSAELLIDLIRENGGCKDPVMRQKLSALHCEAEVLRLNRLRTLSARLAGKHPGPEASIQKLMADEHGQNTLELARDIAGTSGMLEGAGPEGEVPGRMGIGVTENNFRSNQFPNVDPIWHYGYLFSPALTIGGGTFAVQRNIVAEHVLGLQRDINVEKGKTWAEARTQTKD